MEKSCVWDILMLNRVPARVVNHRPSKGGRQENRVLVCSRGIPCAGGSIFPLQLLCRLYLAFVGKLVKYEVVEVKEEKSCWFHRFSTKIRMQDLCAFAVG